MEKSDFTRLVDALEKLQSYYPKNRNDDARRRAENWLKPLTRFPIETVERACETMPEVSPEWFPTLGSILVACKSLGRETTVAEMDATKQAREQESDSDYNRFLETMPADHAAQQNWIDQARNEGERLGRKWVVDSKRKGRKAASVLTAEEARERLSILKTLMGDGSAKKDFRAKKTGSVGNLDDAGEQPGP